MRVIFMGTPDFAVPSLQALLTRHEVVAVVTQPDKPKGRGKKLQPTPVKAVALEHGIPVLQPVKVREPEVIEQLRGYGADCRYCIWADFAGGNSEYAEIWLYQCAWIASAGIQRGGTDAARHY